MWGVCVVCVYMHSPALYFLLFFSLKKIVMSYYKIIVPLNVIFANNRSDLKVPRPILYQVSGCGFCLFKVA